MKRFTIEGFTEGCKAAMDDDTDRRFAAKRYLEYTLANHSANAIVKALRGAVSNASGIGEMILHTSSELTVVFARIPPLFQGGIHNHAVFACIGQLRGEEISTIYKSAADGYGLQVVRTVWSGQGEVIELPEDAIHSIENPADTYSLSLHVYGGDLVALSHKRSLWSANGHVKRTFQCESLISESIKTMRQSRNDRGLAALSEFAPAAG